MRRPPNRCRFKATRRRPNGTDTKRPTTDCLDVPHLTGLPPAKLNRPSRPARNPGSSRRRFHCSAGEVGRHRAPCDRPIISDLGGCRRAPRCRSVTLDIPRPITSAAPASPLGNDAPVRRPEIAEVAVAGQSLLAATGRTRWRPPAPGPASRRVVVGHSVLVGDGCGRRSSRGAVAPVPDPYSRYLPLSRRGVRPNARWPRPRQNPALRVSSL